jgi:DNA-binding HxlR family transcriptional regulator
MLPAIENTSPVQFLDCRGFCGVDTLGRHAKEAFMTGYGQYCPVAKGAEVFAQRWTPLVLRELLRGTTQFNELHRGVPLMSRTLLSQRLRQLAAAGIVACKPGPRGVQYHLTEAGKAFGPVVHTLGEWAQTWYCSTFSEDELDVGVLMWDMRCSVSPDAFREPPVVLRFDISDVPANRRTWWFVHDGRAVDLCPTDPGGDVDLHIATTLRAMTRIWMGGTTLNAAMAAKEIQVVGQSELKRQFRDWLGGSTFAGVQTRRSASG